MVKIQLGEMMVTLRDKETTVEDTGEIQVMHLRVVGDAEILNILCNTYLPNTTSSVSFRSKVR